MFGNKYGTKIDDIDKYPSLYSNILSDAEVISSLLHVLAKQYQILLIVIG